MVQPRDAGRQRELRRGRSAARLLSRALGGARRWVWRAPPLLLVAVALLQLTLVRREHLSAWCGGGFGMFSTADGYGARRLRAVALGPSLRTALEIPPELREEADRALALPTEARLRALAVALAGRLPPDELEAPEAVEIAVFARRHDAETLAPRAELLRAVEVRLEAGRPR